MVTDEAAAEEDQEASPTARRTNKAKMDAGAEDEDTAAAGSAARVIDRPHRDHEHGIAIYPSRQRFKFRRINVD